MLFDNWKEGRGSRRHFLIPFFFMAFLSFSKWHCWAQSIPLVSQCQQGESPVFLLQHNASIAGTITLRTVPVSGGFLECTELCSSAANAGDGDDFSPSQFGFGIATNSPLPLFAHFRPSALLAQLVRSVTAGLAAPITAAALENCTDLVELIGDLKDCIGVRYIAAEAQCQLLDKGTDGGQQSEQNDGSRMVIKSCVKSKKICSSPFHFDVHEQKILVGFAREVVPAESPQQCLTACLDAFDTFGFECESVMYYPVDAECILNTEDRLDRPDLFVDEHEDTVIYLDNNCAGSQCYAPYVTQYVAVEGKQLADELDQTFDGIELAECEERCTQRLSITANDFNCKAFMYNNQSRRCILSDERSKPLGRAQLTDAQAPGWTYHEKKCFASPRTCRNVPSFTRVPQMLLVGFASFVMENVPSVTMCLDQCTNPPPETGQNFVCKSVMYYYNEQECILNAESRQSKPDLFIPEEDDFVVDYFDINCRLEAEQCVNGRTPKLVRTLNAALPEGDGSIHVLETVQAGVQDCAQKCVEHAPDKCRSFNFDKSSGTCNLLYLDGRGSLRPEPKAQIDLYDVHCLNSAQQNAESAQHSPLSCIDPEGAIFSRNLYTRWIANSPNKELASVPLSKCLNLCSTAGEQCEGVNYNRRSGACQIFASLNGPPNSIAEPGNQRQEKSEHVDFYRNVCRVKEGEGVGQGGEEGNGSGAANVPKAPTPQPPVPGAENTTKGPIRNLNNRTLAATKKPTVRIPEVDSTIKRFQPKDGANGEIKVESTTAITKQPAQPPIQLGAPNTPVEGGNEITNSIENKPAIAIGNVGGHIGITNKGPDPNGLPAPVLIPASEVHTICNYEGISVQIKHSEAFSGVVFVKNKYDTCRVEVEAKNSVTLVLGLPANFGMKPISLNPNPSAPHGANRKPKAQADATLAVEASRNESASSGAISDSSSSAETAAEVAAQQQRKRHRRQTQRDCGLQDMENGTYKSVVVVQTNNLGIPGLVTSMDQLYEISCNYSSMLGGKVQAAASLSVQGPQPSLIQPRGKIELGNPVLMQMSPVRSERQSAGADDQGPLVQAKLGDILELRWEIMAMDDELDFFVKDCHAEPGINPSKDQQASSERLQLIEDGCPTPAVAQKLIPNPISVLSSAVKIAHLQAFRFDSSSTVRITCHLELCKGDCKSVNCKMLDGLKESWGRKKRATVTTRVNENGVTEFETRRYKVPRFAQATTSLVIIDPLQKFNEPISAPFLAHSSLSRLAADLDPLPSNLTTNEVKNLLRPAPTLENRRGELCLNKWTLGGVLGTLMTLILVQSGVVAKYMFVRLFSTNGTPTGAVVRK